MTATQTEIQMPITLNLWFSGTGSVVAKFWYNNNGQQIKEVYSRPLTKSCIQEARNSGRSQYMHQIAQTI